MKKILLIILAFLTISSCTCNQPQRQHVQQNQEQKQLERERQEAHKKNWQGFHVIVVDSCEYIEKIRVYHRDMDNRRIVAYAELAHKGNCRFCEERKKKNEKDTVYIYTPSSIFN